MNILKYYSPIKWLIEIGNKKGENKGDIKTYFTNNKSNASKKA